MDLELKGRRAIVTGATQGIGLRIAQQFVDEGMEVAICARTAANVERTVRELAQRGGTRVIGDAVDVTQKDAYTAWINSVAERLGGLDVFVSNTTGTPTHAGEKGWEMGFQADIMAAVRGCETALPYLKRSKGAIVLIASISGVMSKALRAPGILAYGSCKAALIAYGAQLSKEVAKDGVRVNMVSPGPIYFENGPWDHIRQRAPAAYEDALRHCVVGRLGKPEDIAAAVTFLASPKSGFTIGQNLHVDGGYMEHIAF
jgi:NAD(P)-dependent dehydrogenase (short-subunit alcohol dehydrogenase family)